MPTGQTLCLEIDKRDLAHARVAELPGRALRSGEVLMSIDSFAFTASNISYAMHGESRKYWKFFPTSDPGWGCIPAWGFLTVEESQNEDIEPGERFFGFVPTASQWIFSPDKVDELGFIDGAIHRENLPRTYNRYHRLATDSTYRADFENQQLLIRPLFFTAFLIMRHLEENGFYGATQIMISSASCKTAMALSWLLRRRGLRVQGLTSPTGRAFAKNSQNYDEVTLYEEIENAVSHVPTVLIDFSGRNALCDQIHTLLGNDLAYCIRAGETDWQASQSSETPQIDPAKAMLFIASKYLEDNTHGLYANDIRTEMSDELLEFYAQASRWIKTVRALGAEAIQECYDRVLSGKTLASEGFILSFDV